MEYNEYINTLNQEELQKEYNDQDTLYMMEECVERGYNYQKVKEHFNKKMQCKELLKEKHNVIFDY